MTVSIENMERQKQFDRSDFARFIEELASRLVSMPPRFNLEDGRFGPPVRRVR
jgi:hypothetical protein